jgi:hypothetical protein
MCDMKDAAETYINRRLVSVNFLNILQASPPSANTSADYVDTVQEQFGSVGSAPADDTCVCAANPKTLEKNGCSLNQNKDQYPAEFRVFSCARLAI